ncbi:MAG: hypothetical protein H7287_07510 [Thermoleophilia bacterium]|nr:hypothetical protein [Thermoleophilia bacterium]
MELPGYRSRSHGRFKHTGTGPEHAGENPPALVLADSIHDHVVIVYGAGHAEPVAHRWKAQVNVNGKVPCWTSAYPELDHNELAGWEHARVTGGRFALVELLPK